MTPDWVHHNLHTGDVSIRRADNNRKVETALWAIVCNAWPHVSKQSRRTMLRAGQRSVHAMIRGRLKCWGNQPHGTQGARKITYNPFKHDYFYHPDTMQEWTGTPGNQILIQGGYAYELPKEIKQ